MELAVGGLGALEHPLGERDPLLLDQRFAGLDPARAEEGKAHRTADQDRVGRVEEAVDDPDLVAHLRPAEDHAQRPLGVVADRGQLANLTLEQQARVAREQLRDPDRGRVGAVRGAEGVVDVEVGEPRQRRGQLRIVLRLSGLVAAVLEHQRLALAELGSGALDLGPDHAGRQPRLDPGELAEPLGDRGHRELGLAVLRPPQMRDDDDRLGALQEQLDRRQRGADAGVVGDRDRTVGLGQRDVEVDPREHPRALERGVADACLGERPALAQPGASTAARLGFAPLRLTAT